jgi:peptidoglycan/xylan/chitin deacetylase (PgdA/CDA1 family)
MKAAIAAVVFVALAPAATAALRVPADRAPGVPTVHAQRAAVRGLLARRAIVSCGGGHGDAVALTFDDGPGPYTGRIVRILRRQHAHATFFVVGDRLALWPSLVRAEAAVGGVGNHTWSHPILTRLPHWLVWLEILRTQSAVEAEGPRAPQLFRVPYAIHSKATDEVALKLGLVEVFWNVDSGDDVAGVHVRQIVANVRRGLRPGAIVLMHDIHRRTLAALPLVLRAIHERGLRVVSVTELLATDPPAPGQPCPYPQSSGD